jgi:hypothetical protein
VPTSSADRVRAYRERQREAGAPDSSRNWRRVHRRENRERKQSELKPFVACDGEGCNTDAFGRQLYKLFRMGDRELFTGEHLSTEELLDFICDEPSGSILVGFAFGYDVTMILRDLPPRQQAKLFEEKQAGEGRSRYVWYKGFDIEYLPKQYFRVRRAVTHRSPTGEESRKPVTGSSRTIYETFGFFQKSFLNAIKSFDVGTPGQIQSIAENKARRSDFTEIDDEERAYCKLECELLAEMMERLREYCYAAGIRPTSWNGAGKLASALHKLHGTLTRKQVSETIPDALCDFANMAYYGGRFEITRAGLIGQKVYEYDIRSCYPKWMTQLPCLEHGEWREASAGDIASHRGLYVASCTFKHPANGEAQMCGFPVRSQDGHLYWPRQAGGVYWSPEIESARKLGAKVRIVGGWTYHKHCDCKPFDWVEELYDYRRSIGSQGIGYPIKLGINALYGLLAQRVGAGKFANIIWAGLITAMTRAQINEGIALNPGRILMVATDALYSLDPLPLDVGEKLGQWEAVELEDLFLVQPGLYWSPDKRKKKSRGLPGKFFEENGRTQQFESDWLAWQGSKGEDFPQVDVPLQSFVGLKIALARGKPETAGKWVDEIRSISFDYRNKRAGHNWDGGAIVTGCKPGRPGLLSLPHRDFLAKGGQEPWEQARAMLEEQPDYIDLGIPFKD